MKAELDALLGDMIRGIQFERVDETMFGVAVVNDLPNNQRNFRSWWLSNAERVTGPVDLVEALERMAGSDAFIDPDAAGLTVDGINQVRGRLGRLTVQAEVVAKFTKVIDQGKPKARPTQVTESKGHATADEVEIGLGQLENILDDEQLGRMRQADIILALAEMGVHTSDRTLRETTWWNCRQDRRAAGKVRANLRSRVT